MLQFAYLMNTITILRNIGLLSVIFCLMSFSRVAAQEREGLLWAVVKPGQKDTSFLLGTLHHYPKGVVKVPEIALEKLAQSRNLYVEITLDWKMIFGMVFKSGEGFNTIKMDDENWTEQSWDTIKHWFVGIKGMEETKFDRIARKTSGQSILLLFQELMGSDFTGVEETLKTAARLKGLPTKGLDRDWNQIKTWYEYYSTGNELWSTGPLDSLLPESFHGLADLFIAYAIQDTATINQHETDETEWQDGLSLVAWRNVQWMQQLTNLMQQKNFVAVGAAHLYGKNGVINLLRAAGFLVLPIPAHFGGDNLPYFVKKFSANYQLQE